MTIHSHLVGEWPPCLHNHARHKSDKGKHENEEEKKGLKGVKSRELRAGVLYTGCDCIKKNGLQDDCPRSQCQGRPACLTPGNPTCQPGKLALQRVKDAPNASIKRDIDPFKVRCDDDGGQAKPVNKGKPSEPGKPTGPDNGPACEGGGGGQQVLIIMATGSHGGSSDVCPGCGKKLQSGDKSGVCEHCTKNASKAVLRGMHKDTSDEEPSVLVCTPQDKK